MATSFKGEVRDQIAHTIAAIVIIAPLLAFPSVLTAAWVGFMIGTVREVTELKNPVTPAKIWNAIVNSKLDLTFWTLGAAVAYLLFG